VVTINLVHPCCHSCAGVLVERTVGEVLPAVEKNAEMLKQTLTKFKEQIDAKRKEIAAFQTKYKIRIKGQDEPKEEETETKKGGVLV